uniref:ABC transmembrane type-1 domain-containing protein n=1 Tax=Zea mays TaxID=4577 RepID=A0A804N0G4_MAIZE
MLSSVPPIAIAGAIVSKLMTGLSTRMQANYSDAGNVVEQTLGAIRTVVSFHIWRNNFTESKQRHHTSYMLWSLITPVNPANTWGPLIFIFAVSATKEAWDDYNRFKLKISVSVT